MAKGIVQQFFSPDIFNGKLYTGRKNCFEIYEEEIRQSKRKELNWLNSYIKDPAQYTISLTVKFDEESMRNDNE